MTRHQALFIPAGRRYVRRWPVYDGDTGEPLDVSSWSARCQVRSAPRTDAELLAELETTPGSGYVELAVPAELSATWPWVSGWYELVLTEPGQDPERLSLGALIVEPATTSLGP